MPNELKKEGGVGQYWCTTDMICKPIQEDAPVNAASSGAVAGIGIGTQGEPGINLKKKKNIASFISFTRRRQS